MEEVNPDLVAASALSSALRSLPPSAEVLQFYRERLRSFEGEERRWLRKLSAARGLARKTVDLETELDAKESESRALRRAVVDMQSALQQERRRAAAAEAEKARAQFSKSELADQVSVLLDLCGKTEKDLPALMVSKEGGKGLKRRDKRKEDEDLVLERQLAEQEQCHLEQVAALDNERRGLHDELDAARGKYCKRLRELAEHIRSVDEEQESLAHELVDSRSRFRRSEREWAAERETLLRKLQFCQEFGALPTQVADDAFFTSQRSAMRLAGEGRLKKQIQRLHAELAEQKAVSEQYRNKTVTMEAEMELLRDQNSSGKKALERRTKAMMDQVDKLKERYEDLEKRKRNEAQGYQSDVKLLNQKIRHVENQLMRASLTKSKEHDYIKAIRAYERELEEVRRSLRRSPQWLS